MLTMPSTLKNDLNNMAEQTREIVQGRKMMVLKVPLNFSFALFSMASMPPRFAAACGGAVLFLRSQQKERGVV
jgi:hypothetical protein